MPTAAATPRPRPRRSLRNVASAAISGGSRSTFGICVRRTPAAVAVAVLMTQLREQGPPDNGERVDKGDLLRRKTSPSHLESREWGGHPGLQTGGLTEPGRPTPQPGA